MKSVLSILLGMMLLTSLVGISYATPIVQPAQDSGNSCANLSPNNPNYTTLGCAGAAHQGGNENPPSHGCVAPVGRISPDGGCCRVGRIGPDTACCVDGITPHSLDVSDIQADRPYCGPP